MTEVLQPLSETNAVDKAIATYGLGEKLRRLRLRKKISLVDLGKHTGLSPSLLSQLETGKLVPTLPTLTRISMVFDVGLEFFFAGPNKEKLFSIVRASERMRFPERAGITEPGYFFECLAFSVNEKALQAYVADFPPRPDPSQEHSHDGSEFLFVTEGSVEIRSGGAVHSLDTGDSAYFDSSEPHSYRSAGDSSARAIVVTATPRL
ncbi:MAG: XRE family transcriptional regulator [Bryobacteraceae bacterium]